MRKRWHISELLLKSCKTWVGQSSVKGAMNTQLFYKSNIAT